MDNEAKNITALLLERASDYNKACDALKNSRNFVEWDAAREDMRMAIGSMSELIDKLVIQYNAMAKKCGVTNRKAIVESYDLAMIDYPTHKLCENV